MLHRMNVRALGCAVLTAAGATVAGAQARSDSLARDTMAFRLKGVIVQATRPVTTSGGASALEVRLDSMRLPPAPTLERALRELPFVQVRTNPRGEGYFAIRGSGFDAREVAVIVDGVSTTLNFDDRSDLSVLPITGAQTLTLVRGLPSLLYGPNVLGGVVELGVANGTSFGEEGRRADMTAGVDHTGARALSGTMTVPFLAGTGSFLRAGGGYRRSNGFPLPNGVHEPAPFTSDDRRLNSDREQRDGFVAARLATEGGAWASFSSFAYSGNRGTPAELHITTPQLLRFPLLRRSFSVLSLGSGERHSPLGGRGSLQVGVGYDAGRTKLEGFTSRTYSSIKNQEDDDDRNLNLHAIAEQSIASRGDLRSSFTYSDVKRHEILTPGATSDYQQRLWSAASELGWSLPAGGIGLSTMRATAGLAYDGADTPETGGKPLVGQLTTWGGRAGVTAMSRGGNVLMHAGASRRVRFPSLRELYSGTLTQIEPNPLLKPELLVAMEAGVTAKVGRAQLQGVAFHNDITDAIVRSTVNKKVKRVNRDRTTGSGVELLASMPVARVNVFADVTAQSVGSSDPSSNRDYIAEYQPKFAGGVRLAAPLPFDSRADLSARAVGSQYCVNATSGYDRIDPSTRLNAELSKRWRGVESIVGLDNLTNRAVYDQCGLPQPGRLLRLQILVR
jgi:iron complex outermembrane receptor protein